MYLYGCQDGLLTIFFRYDPMTFPHIYILCWIQFISILYDLDESINTYNFLLFCMDEHPS